MSLLNFSPFFFFFFQTTPLLSLDECNDLQVLDLDCKAEIFRITQREEEKREREREFMILLSFFILSVSYFSFGGVVGLDHISND